VAIHRALDASVNRATEAIRTTEDIARFALNDAFLAQSCKDLRHELIDLMEPLLPASARLRARDTEGDVGTALAAPTEYVRKSMAQLAASNFKRAQQAVRSLEEFAKLSHGEIAAQLERLRYRLYTLEVPFTVILDSQNRLGACPLCVLIDGRTSMSEFRLLVEDLVLAGAPMIQLRDKQLTDLALYERARALVQLTRSPGIICVINDRVDVAVASGADGVHLGQDDLPVATARRQLPPGTLIGVSTHSLDQARHAVLSGADYLGVGPVFASRTKGFDELPGLSLVHGVTSELALPCFAIGGVTPQNLGTVLEAGATRVAVQDAILSAKSPGQMVAGFLQQLRQTGSPTAPIHA
jgi:thiamine-phosphate pyrophosphorylase